MSVTSGFFNSSNHDRRYNAIQMSSMFDGIIRDGIFATIGDAMVVEAGTGMTVFVGSGRAWFNHTWTLNDAKEPITAEESEVILDRIDALVLEVNSSQAVRQNEFKFVKGTPSSSPERPSLISTEEVHQYPLCYISIPAGATEITQSQITNMVGTDSTPFITGILETVSVETLLLQWEAQWNDFIAGYEENIEDWTDEQKDEIESIVRQFNTAMNAFEQAAGQDFTSWFAALQDILDQDTAGHLQNEIEELAEKEFKYYYDIVNKETTITDGLSGKRIVETSSEMVATTTFAKSGGITTITTNLEPTSGNFNYIKTVVITPTGSGKTITESYVKRGKS